MKKDDWMAVSRYTFFIPPLILNTFHAFIMGKSDASVVECAHPLP